MMNELVMPLLANVLLASMVWLLSLLRRNASLVDLIWSLMFVLAAWLWFDPLTAGVTSWLVLGLVMIWGARLHIYLVWRNAGQPEDHRYQAIRQRNGAGFWWKSYFLVFLLQSLLAWICSLVIYGALQYRNGPNLWIYAGVSLALIGFLFEAIGDWQLSRFKRDKDNAGKVMDKGLWHYSRHPNYFGECCFWWGISLVSLAAGYWWTLISPVLMTVLLLKVSGVSLLESDISDRRPAYREYIHVTPAFFPWVPRPVNKKVVNT